MKNVAKAALCVVDMAWSALSCVVTASLILDMVYDMQDVAKKRRKEKYARLE